MSSKSAVKDHCPHPPVNSPPTLSNTEPSNDMAGERESENENEDSTTGLIWIGCSLRDLILNADYQPRSDPELESKHIEDILIYNSSRSNARSNNNNNSNGLMADEAATYGNNTLPWQRISSSVDTARSCSSNSSASHTREEQHLHSSNNPNEQSTAGLVQSNNNDNSSKPITNASHKNQDNKGTTQSTHHNLYEVVGRSHDSLDRIQLHLNDLLDLEYDADESNYLTGEEYDLGDDDDEDDSEFGRATDSGYWTRD